mgnify:CR=1 FL=1
MGDWIESISAASRNKIGSEISFYKMLKEIKNRRGGELDLDEELSQFIPDPLDKASLMPKIQGSGILLPSDEYENY